MADSTRKFTLRLILSVVTNVGLYVVALFLPARTFHWWRAWVVICVLLVGIVWAIASLYHSHRSILEERLKPLIQKGQPLADRILASLFLLTYMGLVVFVPFDVFRLHLLAKPEAVVSSLGLVLMAFGWWIAQLSIRENAFASAAVRLQEERQQRVVDTGVYSVVRHPLYAGAFILLIGMTLWLESYASTVLALVPLAVICTRILFEERFLKRELPGYSAYLQKVRYRLVPLVW